MSFWTVWTFSRLPVKAPRLAHHMGIGALQVLGTAVPERSGNLDSSLTLLSAGHSACSSHGLSTCC